MNEEMKRIFGKFLFTTVIIACLGAFFAGEITVGERGEYNLNMTKYAVMSFSGTSEKLEAEFNENRLTVGFPENAIKSTVERFVCLTPFSPFYYFLKGAGGLMKEFF
ncbi:MAG: hypothetical protein IJB93_03220 [Clostridia bacterium]|nr:hypothetical protein [Clostridia bacterium]